MKISLKKIYLFGVVFIFILGSVLHFTYEWSNNNFFVSFFSSINESVWEHTKLLIYPTIIWYSLCYFFYSNSLNKNKWFTACLISLLVTILVVPICYYFYTGAFGVESFIVDILIFLFACIMGSLFSYKYYNSEVKGIKGWILLIIFLLIIYLYIYLTFNPLNLPIFIAK